MRTAPTFALLALFGLLPVPNILVAANPPEQTPAVSKPVEQAGDPYLPLHLYEGKWDVIPAGANKPGDTVHLENRCAQAGVFFACNQVVSGKSVALVVFLPTHSLPDGGYAYRNQALRPDVDGSGTWGNLEINGDHWVYSSEETDKDKKIYHRILNAFSGNDKIHFEVQASDDGVKWTTNMSGYETRVK
jgi:hypothetical protein